MPSVKEKNMNFNSLNITNYIILAIDLEPISDKKGCTIRKRLVVIETKPLCNNNV